MEIETKTNQIKENLEKALKETKDLQSLNELRIIYLGKKGEIQSLMTLMKDATPEEKKELGKAINDIKVYAENNINTLKTKLEVEETNKKLEKEKIDITLPSIKLKTGGSHPVTKMIDKLEELFMSMGYDVVEGPELENDLYNFEMLNLPKGHPARDMQDTFYITEEKLLRTQTSPVQVRTMLANEEKKPLRIVCPGKTYRRDNDDATHTHQFTQFEGLVIDKDISLADLKGTLDLFAKEFFGEDKKTRFRPSYYPFTEPSVEYDVECPKCGGKGCDICKTTGYLTVMGAGMVHPNVLKMSGYDPEVYCKCFRDN